MNISTTDIIEIEFPESPIPDGTVRRLDEVTVRRDGCVWRIHKSDADPFPSRPHAHNMESGLKLDIGNGRLYCLTCDAGKKNQKKHLEFIRAELEQRGFSDLPPLEN